MIEDGRGRPGRSWTLALAAGLLACAASSARAGTVEVSPLKDAVVLPSLTAGNGEIITAAGALFLPWRAHRADTDYEDAVRVEAGIALGGFHGSVGISRAFSCPHAMDFCLCPYIAPEIYRAAWRTNWDPRTYAGLDLGVSLALLKFSLGILHPIDGPSPLSWQIRVGLGW